jgi:cation diffusion facilitator CzcD-associated flavoprotein CzcO
MENLDVLVVGAGLSGVAAGHYLKTKCPKKTFAIFEAREAIGGTWDLFRYPGIRSDSDMYTLGYRFRPWRGGKAIADGPSILEYIRETAREEGLDPHIRFDHRVVSAAWSSKDARWTVTVRTKDGEKTLTASFLIMCSGYYDYDGGYTPELAGIERFRGRVVHPQKWTDDIDYQGKRVVVIGSGATAVTLVPELAKKAEHVVMLQRSPTYIVSLPAVDPIANFLTKRLSVERAYDVTRWKNVILSMAMYNLSRRFPDRMKKLFIGGVKKSLGESYDVQKHFTPSYGPWDQRLCLVPDGDLFDAIKAGRAEVVTDHIESFTEKGIRLKSGNELAADLVVTATGLRVSLLGKMAVSVDGESIDVAKTLTYKGTMFSDVPNLFVALGYTNASWTLKCDLTCEWVCRIMNVMDKRGQRVITARRRGDVDETPIIDFSSGYIQRAKDKLPKQGPKAPWRLYQNYLLDLIALRYGRIDDDVVEIRG